MDVKEFRGGVGNGLILILVFFITICSCKEKIKEVPPSNLIARDTMVKLIAEMHLLESSFGIKIFDEKKITTSRNAIKSKIYKDYGISKERFFESYNYYVQQSQTIDSIYTDVISEISKRQTILQKK